MRYLAKSGEGKGAGCGGGKRVISRGGDHFLVLLRGAWVGKEGAWGGGGETDRPRGRGAETVFPVSSPGLVFGEKVAG